LNSAWIAAFAALAALVVLLGLVVLGTLRRITPLIERVEATIRETSEQAARAGLQPGSPVPAFAATEIGGHSFTDRDLRRSRTLLLFVGSSCAACDKLVSDLQSHRIPELEARLVIVADDAEEAPAFAAPSVTVLTQVDHSVAQSFESDRIPHAFVIDQGRIIASGWPNDWNTLRQLLDNAEKGGDREPNKAAAVVAS
jgi:peroxiredoxin